VAGARGRADAFLQTEAPSRRARGSTLSSWSHLVGLAAGFVAVFVLGTVGSGVLATQQLTSIIIGIGVAILAVAGEALRRVRLGQRLICAQ
jgi:hypothetical protein